MAISLNSSNRKRLESVEQQHKNSLIQLEQKLLDKQKSVNEFLYSLPTRADLADVESRLEAYKSTFTDQLYTLNNEQQHLVSIIQLEQKLLDKQKSVNEVLYSLPTQADLADVENRLEAYKSTFTEQLYTLNKQQSNTHLELQKINSDRSNADIQHRICVLENLLQLHNPAHLHTLQENQVSIEAKIQNLEQQFNLPITNLQHQLLQLQDLINHLQLNSTQSTQFHEYLVGEFESLSQQIQSVNSQIQGLSLAYTEIQTQLKSLAAPNLDKIDNDIKFMYAFIDSEFQPFVDRVEGKLIDDTQLKQHLAQEVQSLRQQVQAVSNSVSERIKSIQVELQSHQSYVKKSESKIYADIDKLTDWYKKLEDEVKKLVEKNGSVIIKKVEQSKTTVSSTNKVMCEHCYDDCKNDPIPGGFFV